MDRRHTPVTFLKLSPRLLITTSCFPISSSTWNAKVFLRGFDNDQNAASVASSGFGHDAEAAVQAQDRHKRAAHQDHLAAAGHRGREASGLGRNISLTVNIGTMYRSRHSHH